MVESLSINCHSVHCTLDPLWEPRRSAVSCVQDELQDSPNLSRINVQLNLQEKIALTRINSAALGIPGGDSPSSTYHWCSNWLDLPLFHPSDTSQRRSRDRSLSAEPPWEAKCTQLPNEGCRSCSDASHREMWAREPLTHRRLNWCYCIFRHHCHHHIGKRKTIRKQ